MENVEVTRYNRNSDIWQIDINGIVTVTQHSKTDGEQKKMSVTIVVGVTQVDYKE